MTITRTLDENFAPYASAKSVIQVIERYRERNLPDPLTQESLQQVGIPASMASPTYRALVFLRLIDENGAKTKAFENIKLASQNDYPQALGEAIRQAYSDVFVVADPSRDDDTAISDAFRRFSPATQRDRMVRLFLGLCEEAGISPPRPKRRTNSPTTQSRHQKNATPVAPPVNEAVVPRRDEFPRLEYSLVNSIVQQLPSNGLWTADKREKWITAMISAIDLLFDVQEESPHNVDKEIPESAMTTFDP